MERARYEVKERTFNMKPLITSEGAEIEITSRIPHEYNNREKIHAYKKYKLVIYENCLQLFVKGVTIWLPLSEVLKIQEFKKKQPTSWN